MGRKSSLTDAQWAEIGARRLAGERPVDLAREFGVSAARIVSRFGKAHAEVKAVANQMVDAERALAALPKADQIAALSLAAQLRSISDHLASAANYGAATAHRLSALANSEVQKVDDAKPLESLDTLRGVASLTKLANDASTIGLNLLTANKERAKQFAEEDEATDGAMTLDDFYGRTAKA